MTKIDGVSIYIKNYKCFADEPNGFSEIRPINVIIGRNNSGKSSLIEMLSHAISYKDEILNLGRSGKPPTIIIDKPVSHEELAKVFQRGISGGGIPGDHGDYALRLPPTRLRYELVKNTKKLSNISPPFHSVHPETLEMYGQRLVEAADNPFSTFALKRLNAERNISPENESDRDNLASDGEGFTNIVRRFVNMDSLPSELIEVTLLAEINKIVQPDMNFIDIVVQQNQATKQWEIFLEEEHKGRISIRNSGSGIKTVLLTLGFLHLIPFIEKKKLNNYIFCLEELENNLHPAIQRRLLQYLREFVDQHKCIFVLTTHSSVFIDFFSSDNSAQIIHVTHNAAESKARPVKTFVQRNGILDDLDVRASDLLQSNCIVWVEGPSDRIYINRWIELCSEKTLKEGAHYQCVFYGGRLLAHLSAPQNEKEISAYVSILKVNRNSIVVIDSDRTRNRTEINSTKSRIKTEVESCGGMSWITDGREIENYIPPSLLSRLYPNAAIPKMEKWGAFHDYLEQIKMGEGTSFRRSKVLFAERASLEFSNDDFAGAIDLKNKVDDIVRQIRVWNSMLPSV